MNNNEMQSFFANLMNKGEISEKEVDKNKVQQLMSSLNEKQTQQIENILNDPKKTQEILNSPQAQALIKRLMNNG